MTRALLFCAASLFTTGCVSRTAPLFVDDGWSVEAWHDLGGGPATVLPISVSTVQQTAVALALDGQSYPVVAYDDGGAIGVRHWTGTSWADLGSPGTGLRVALALDSHDSPWVAWDGEGTPATVRVAWWDGSSWQLQPDIPTGGAIPAASFLWPALVFDSARRAVVAAGSNGDDVTCVHRWEAPAWQLLSPSGAPCLNGNEHRPSIMAGPSETLLLADSTLDGTWVRQWSADTWGAMEIVVPAGYQTFVAITQAARGLTVAGQDASGAFPGRVPTVWQKRGGAWTQLGDLSTTVVVGLVRPALAVDGTGEPIVAWADTTGSEIHVRFWTGVRWSTLMTVQDQPVYDETVVGMMLALAADETQVCVAFYAASAALADHTDVRVRCAAPAW